MDHIIALEIDDSMPSYVKAFNDYFMILITELRVVKAQTTRLAQLELENDSLKQEIETLKARVDDQEQRSRNSCLVIHGITETDGKSTDDIVIDTIRENLEININANDIVRSHRIGPVKTTRPTNRSARPRPIIFRFSNYRKKQEVFKAKKALKGKKIVITESLTSSRLQLLEAAKQKFGKFNVWTNEGRVLRKVNNQIVSINNMNDLT